MSRETMTTLNTSTLIGFTEKRGNAWHYRAEEQGDESNHYPGAIPVGDVKRRLLDWQAESRPIMVQIPSSVEDITGLDDDGNPVMSILIPGKQAVVRSDTHAVMGIFASSYVIHQYEKWLVEQVSTLLGDTLQIGSAGVLKGGALAWVSVEAPENVVTPEGIEFRPNLLATTSHDGTLATTYKRVITNVACDNGHAVALSEDGQQYKVKHSSKSLTRLAEARDALHIVETLADDFSVEVKALCEMSVTDRQWAQFLDAHAPIPKESKAGATRAEARRDKLSWLYRQDERAATWTGTGWGVVQAVNTYQHHYAQVNKGVPRGEKNMLNMVSGKIETVDREALSILRQVVNA